jgi:hypothetical protein
MIPASAGVDRIGALRYTVFAARLEGSRAGGPRRSTEIVSRHIEVGGGKFDRATRRQSGDSSGLSLVGSRSLTNPDSEPAFSLPPLFGLKTIAQSEQFLTGRGAAALRGRLVGGPKLYPILARVAGILLTTTHRRIAILRAFRNPISSNIPRVPLHRKEEEVLSSV